MTEPITWTAVGMAAVSNVAAWLTIIVSHRRAKANGNGKKPCLDHEKRLTGLETHRGNQEKNFELFRKENREDHQRIFDAIGNTGPGR